jgi:IclR family KDG regulon transcriptional repressor
MASSLARAIAVLELVNRNPGGLTNLEISRTLRMPSSSCSYITKELETHGYLERDQNTRRFTIGLSIAALAYGALRDVAVRTASEPVLHRIASETTLAVGIGVLHGCRVLVVDRAESPSVLGARASGVADPSLSRAQPQERPRPLRDVLRDLPAHATALGKVLLAFLPDETLTDLLDRAVIERSTPKTIVSRTRLLDELDSVKDRGYATAREELYSNVRALAVPIFGARDRVVAAMSLNGRSNAPAWENESNLIRILTQGACSITAAMRHQHTTPEVA